MKALVAMKAQVLANISSHIIHEGGGSDIVRPDGTAEQTEMAALSAEVVITKAKLDDFDEETVKDYLDHIAEQFAKSQSEHLFRVMSEGVEKVGNVVDGGGQPLSPELLLKAFEKLHLDFDAEGNWKPPTMVVSPEMGQRLEEQRDTFESPEHMKKLEALIDRKRDEFRRREAGRVLAG